MGYPAAMLLLSRDVARARCKGAIMDFQDSGLEYRIYLIWLTLREMGINCDRRNIFMDNQRRYVIRFPDRDYVFPAEWIDDAIDPKKGEDANRAALANKLRQLKTRGIG